jgi:hypothetical protein
MLFHPAAQTEYEDAFAWYQARSPAAAIPAVQFGYGGSGVSWPESGQAHDSGYD